MLIGKQIAYSIGDKKEMTGVVLDKLDMLQTSSDPALRDNNGKFTITGYLVECDEDGLVYVVQYWRIKRVLGQARKS
jgi:hypothetical protein